ncbi:hypothetical protein A6B35_29935 (plasmid) [Mesorhizobium amorphae CCNWGS0123]|nr:hypothetical protein A6B35_29935 [Mesorhizobium amorphae CCNWGS0123]
MSTCQRKGIAAPQNGDGNESLPHQSDPGGLNHVPHFARTNRHDAVDCLADHRLLHELAYVDGRWTASEAAEGFEVTDPASGGTVAFVSAFDAGQTTPPRAFDTHKGVSFGRPEALTLIGGRYPELSQLAVIILKSRSYIAARPGLLASRRARRPEKQW